MTKIKKFFMFLVFGIMASAVLVGCSKQVKVTYFVDDKVYVEETIDRTKEIKLPKDPEKKGYTFQGWMFKADSKPFTKTTKIKKDTEVVAVFKPITIERFIDGEKTTVELLNIDKDLPGKEGLVLDKWYTDPEYKTPYVNQTVDKLYARFVAMVTFNNGHEVLKELKVPVNETVPKPELNDILRPYMDKNDISYLNPDGSEYDFNEKIAKSKEIHVSWHSPYLQYEKNLSTGKYKISDCESSDEATKFWREFRPYVSRFPSKYVERDADGKVIGVHDVEAVNGSMFTALTKKVIIDEGIKYVSDFIGNSIITAFDELVLPKSVRVLENCFNGWDKTKLEKIVIPEGVEQIIKCFWADDVFDQNEFCKEIEGFTFKLPKTVKSLSKVPTNIEVEGNKDYYRETKNGNNYLYHKESDNTLTLISATTATSNQIVVPEGVNNIKVGFYSYNPQVKFIHLPESFQKVIFNGKREDYKYYTGKALLDTTSTPYGDETEIDGYAIISRLDALERVIFNSSAYPTAVHDSAISGKKSSSYMEEYDDYTQFNDKTVFVKEVASGENVKVTVNVHNLSTGVLNENTPDGKPFVFEGKYKSGDVINENELLSDLSLVDLSHKYIIKGYEQFGENFDLTKPLKANVYLDVYYNLRPAGFKYEINAQNEIVITGFESTTALLNSVTNLYTVVIPEEFEGKKVVGIKDEAFSEVEQIEMTILPKTVKYIGDKAFYRTTNLKKVLIPSGDLETVGRSAFEGSGLEDLTLSIKNVKEIKPYAFKNQTLKEFKLANGEEDRFFGEFDLTGKKLYYPKETETGKFFLLKTEKGAFEIFKFTGMDKMKVKGKETDTEPTVEVNVYDMQLVAVAGGFVYDYFSLKLGISFRPSRMIDYLKGNLKKQLESSVVRYEIMEGSVYYLKDKTDKERDMSIGLVKKVHKNAFTDMQMVSSGSGTNKLVGEVYTNSSGQKITNGITRYVRGKGNPSEFYEELLTKDDLKNKDIFVEGWWEGLTGDAFEEFTNGIGEDDTYLIQN